MTFRFAKPSVRRLLWSVVAVTVTCCVIVSSAYVIGAIVTATDDPAPPSTGEYVQLAVVFLTFWSPLLLLNFWYISLPVIVALGVLVACVRRTPADKRGERHAAGERSGSG
jgi:hypothetical protein